MKVIKTGLLWMLKADLSDGLLNELRCSYTYPHPHDGGKAFPTFVELSDKVGVPAGDVEKFRGLIKGAEVVDQTIVEPVERPINLTGLTLRDYQESSLTEALDYFNKEGGTSFNLSGSPGCVDKDTEFMTPQGWKRIAEYDNDEVLQVDNNMNSSFTDATFVDQPANGWYLFDGVNTSMKLSGEHRVIYETPKGNLCEKSAESLYQERTGIKLYSNVKSIEFSRKSFSDAEIRLIVVVAAEGSIMDTNDGTVRINLKKRRKKDRLIEILDAVGLRYNVIHTEDYSSFSFCHIGTKDLTQLWGCDMRQMRVVYDEFVYWAGYTDKRTGCRQFSSAHKPDVDFIQYIITNVRGTVGDIDICDRVEQPDCTGGEGRARKPVEYIVRETTTRKKYLDPKRGGTHRASFTFAKSLPGERKYCFTVPSGMFLARKNNFVFVTGNSGKSIMLSAIVAKLGVKTLIIAHLSMLTSQLKEEIEHFTDANVRVLDKDNLELGDVNIATSQFISRRPELWYQIKRHIGLIVADEAESLASETTMRIFQRAHAKYRIAVTATFTRSVDGRTPALIDMIGRKVITLVNDKLLKPTIISVHCDEYFQAPRNKNLYKKALVKFFKSNISIADKVIKTATKSVEKGRQVLIATDLTEFQTLYAEMLEAKGIKCGIMNGGTKKDERAKILKEYDDGRVQVLVGFGVLNAGLSIPKISTIIRVSTPGNLEKLEQLVGRGRRDYNGKEGMWFIDFMFTGFRYANDKRRAFYNRKKVKEGWTYASTTWQKFEEKL